jgi:hypothetical protein
MKSYRIPFQLSALAVAALVSACGGGSASAPGAIAGSSGFAVDDYIANATVVCDQDGNGVHNGSEPKVQTDANGFFSFTSPDCKSPLVVTGGTNIDTKLPFVGTLKAPAGSLVVTPLTTLMVASMSSDQMIKAFDLPAGTDLTKTDPARSINGKLQQSDLFKKTIAMQQLIQKTAETLSALVPASQVNTVYAQVAAAMAKHLATNPQLISGKVFDENAVAALVTASAKDLQSALGTSVNPTTLGAMMASALKVQGDRILGATDATLTATTLKEQGSSTIKDFIVNNKAALTGANSTLTTDLAAQLKTEIIGLVPTKAPSTVIPSDAIVIYSDAASVSGLNAAPDWGQNPPVDSSEPSIANNKLRKYVFSAGALYQGLGWEANPQNVTTKGKLHLDFFSPDISSVKVSLISPSKENAVTKNITLSAWNSIDIDLNEFTVPDKTQIFQIKLEPNTAGTLYVDNIYFWDTSPELNYASNYTNTFKTTQGGDFGWYFDEGNGVQWWDGVAPSDATPSYYRGYGLLPAAWGFGTYVKAPSNGVAQVSAYANIQLSVWGNDELVNQSPRPNFSLIMKAPSTNGCTPEVKKDFQVTGAGVQTYTIPLSGMTVHTVCGALTTAAGILATGVTEVHVQVVGANLNKTNGTDRYANGLNMGPIKFTK